MTFHKYIETSGFDEIALEEARQTGLLMMDHPYQATRFWLSKDGQHGAALDHLHRKFFLWHRAFGTYRSGWLHADASYE